MRGQMANSCPTMTVVDVYDVAASIGKEFEKIIDTYGPEAVTQLMPKVINVLEQLEILASSNQKENAEISELRFDIERLTAEKVAKTEERHKYEQELEQIEDSWRKETRELVETVSRLQEDNRKIRAALSQHSQQQYNAQKAEQEEEQKTASELQNLKDMVHKQRSEIRGLQREITSKALDIEAGAAALEQEVRHKARLQHDLEHAHAQIHVLVHQQHDTQQMQSQLERMAKLNADYRRKTTLTQQRAQNLIQEKADLQANLHDKEQQIATIKQHINQADSIESPNSPTLPGATGGEEDLEKLTERLMGEGKYVIDLKDPDRPRFTLNELREVLTERNELKTKLIEVEEELQHYKPVEMSRDEEQQEDAPVQGPLPQEPWEKLNPGAKQESGIRKLFTRFLEKIETIKKELDDDQDEPKSTSSDE